MLNRILYKVGKSLDKSMSRRGGGALLNVGDEAPGFETIDHEGRKVALRDFSGKHVVLWFYPRASTPG